MKGIPREKRSGLEQSFLTTWHLLHLGPDWEPAREFTFYDLRNWRFDFAWTAEQIAVEIEGGTASGRSRHTKPRGYQADSEKYNTAAALGWRVLRFTAQDLRERPVIIAHLVEAAITLRRGEIDRRHTSLLTKAKWNLQDYARLSVRIGPADVRQRGRR